MRKKLDQKYLKELGNRIRKLRKARLLTQEKLAEYCDLHNTYLGGIERGERNPSVCTLLRIAEGLEVELKDLLAPVSGKRAGEREEVMLEILALLERRGTKDLQLIKMVVSDIVKWAAKPPAGM